jgi:DNA-3-methyladenine glycosylase I
VDGAPVQNRWEAMGRIPPRTALSDAISKELQARGFKFVGSTIVYAFMQAVGMVNDHVVTCFRYEACAKLGRKRSR